MDPVWYRSYRLHDTEADSKRVCTLFRDSIPKRRKLPRSDYIVGIKERGPSFHLSRSDGMSGSKETLIGENYMSLSRKSEEF